MSLNARYQRAKDAGRQRRLAAELAGMSTAAVPLHSHNATYQSAFRKGWQSVNSIDINAHLLKQRAQTSQRTPSVARQALNEIHQLFNRA
ncbi:hypothetical protein G3R49_12505 [Shewanella sp. WXL01]|uniref:hypothetical protein n=1 Tax=Shewanella sp. WXL01 TaxID=2709721 RepID=UPI0014382676|nr:hypothetical protein [Shewanella sp. WXL01]NKF51379.1 hypothetical protein [Shewanella sp. WXL01]